MPSWKAKTLPDVLSTMYYEAIREGATAELLGTFGTPYYRPEDAAVAYAKFQQAIDRATTDVWRSHTGRVSRGRISWC